MDRTFSSDKDRLKHYITDEDRRLFSVWEDSLKQGDLPLADTIAGELADYFHQSIEEVKAAWAGATSMLKLEWEQQNPQTAEEIVDFYDRSVTYIYELSYWHTLELNDGLIQNVKSLELALGQPGRDYLDFGGGTGSNIILFAKHGFNCTLADISASILDFARWRMKRHGIAAEVVDLKTRELASEAYDFTTVVDTLEHVIDPVATMKEITRATRKGGIITAWVPFFRDAERPMHLAVDMDIVSEFPSLGLQEIESDDTLLVKTYRKI